MTAESNPSFCPWCLSIDGITDSKQIKDEAERERLYEQITAPGSGVIWAVVSLDHTLIDELNILEV